MTQVDAGLPTGFIKARGEFLTVHKADGAWEKIVLQGVNAGGWLVTEDWMCPTSLSPDDLKGEHGMDELADGLRAAIGAEATNQLFALYRDRWWTAADFDNVKALGLNCLRLPFVWRDLIDERGEPLPNGFDRIDWFVRECNRRGLWVVLDLHGAPGSQNGRHHSGDTRVHSLFDDPAMLALCCKVWTLVATRYRGDPTIAAYDLLNEPEGQPGGTFHQKKVREGHDALFKAVRAADPDHVIMVEAVWDADSLPRPEEYGWDNVCYQYHFYEWGNYNDFESKKRFVASKIADQEKFRHGVPLFVGEFTFFDNPESWAYALKTFNARGWGWTLWTYKVCLENSGWGLYNGLKRAPENVVTPRDDYASAAAKWGRVATADSFARNEWLAKVLRENAIPAPAAPAPRGR